MSSWTPERRAKQAALLKQTKPWLKSTGPKTAEGKASASINAYKGGVRPVLRECQKLTKRLRGAIAEREGQ